MALSESTRQKAALAVAMTTDFLQVSLFPIFGEGILSPFNDALDIIACGLLCMLLGWHYSFMPALMAESIPGLNLVPTWTAAVLLVTKKKKPEAQPSATPGKPPVIVDV